VRVKSKLVGQAVRKSGRHCWQLRLILSPAR
jgi:hypothetical protein